MIVTGMGYSVTIRVVVVLIVTQTLLSVTNAALGMGDCHVNGVFCDDICDE